MDIAIHDNDMAWNVPLVVEEQLIELGGMRQKESSPMALVHERAATEGKKNTQAIPGAWVLVRTEETIPVS